MPGVARIDDTITTGHGCDATSTVVGPTGATAKVFVNNRAVECKDNPVNSHTILSGIVCVPHSAVINVGSPNVFVGGIAVARLTDSVDSGEITSASTDVIANG